MSDDFKFGIEEEFFVVDATTRSARTQRPEAFFAAVKKEIGDQVRGEMLQSQIEIATLPHKDMSSATAELKFLRQSVAKIAARHGLGILAAGTHPTAVWTDSIQSPGERSAI